MHNAQSWDNMDEKDNIAVLKEEREGAEERSLEMSLFRAPTHVTTSKPYISDCWKQKLGARLDCLWSVWHTSPPRPQPPYLLWAWKSHFPELPSLCSPTLVTSDLRQIWKVKVTFLRRSWDSPMLGFLRCRSLWTFPLTSTSQSWPALQTSPQIHFSTSSPGLFRLRSSLSSSLTWCQLPPLAQSFRINISSTISLVFSRTPPTMVIAFLTSTLAPNSPQRLFVFLTKPLATKLLEVWGAQEILAQEKS